MSKHTGAAGHDAGRAWPWLPLRTPWIARLIISFESTGARPRSGIPEIYATAGFDFVIIDTEHGLNDVQTAVAHLRSERAAGIDALIRVGAANLGDVPRLLDAGCEGIMIPHFGLPGSGSTDALKATRYAPLGSRPTCTGVSAAGFGIADFASYVERANRDILTIGLVEDRESLLSG